MTMASKAPSVQSQAYALYREFIDSITNVISMPEMNRRMDKFLAERGFTKNTLVYDAVYDCKDKQLLADVGGVLPKGSYPEGI